MTLKLPFKVQYRGKEYSLYTYSFTHNNKTFSSYFHAENIAEAQKMIKSIKNSAHLEGALVSSTDVDLASFVYEEMPHVH